MQRYYPVFISISALAACVFFAQSCRYLSAPRVNDNALSGGETTVFTVSHNAFAKPLANLPTKDLRTFTFGNKMFNTNWVQAPASVTSLDGLGPTFNRVSCSSCHFKDGRGQPPENAAAPMQSMLVRLSIPGKAKDGGPKPHPDYGSQLNTFGISDVPGEGIATVSYEEDITGVYDDGAPYNLRKPVYHFSNMAFGELGDNTLFSPRVAPAMHGLGLLEAIPSDAILALTDKNDANKDGISGRVNTVPGADGRPTIGRFGWKANVATLSRQNAGAAIGDLGITTSLHPEQNCPKPQHSCRKAKNGGSPEMSDTQLKKITFYTQTLAPPARRDVDDPNVQRGAFLFSNSQCASCHIPQMQTGEHAVASLSNQKIQPFTDLLLHDMGEGLADGRPDYDANGNEWRTPPLWGIGLTETVNRHTNFLHDGRARNLEEAILWHGGEAASSVKAFKKLSADDRAALLRFLESL